ncbi:MAG: sigma-54-dependent Fis family transcriptional regulator [Planctomycetes bacterium]|nr:sigma-54-dependent Fis family transcriptional regulator [Planctomycetota bacterium]
MTRATIELVEHDPRVRLPLKDALAKAGYTVIEASSGEQALRSFQEAAPDLVLLALKLPEVDGLTVLKEMKRLSPQSLAVILTPFATVEGAIEALKHGADDYISSVLKPEEIRDICAKLIEDRRSDPGPVDSQASFDAIIGESPPMRELKALLRKVAATNSATVLITGESGTGKDLAAKAIHSASKRAARPFMNITCSALPETLLESELFGHEKGSFTDARQQKIGLLEQADGGTVFLDEIGEMQPMLQAKLLRFLEEKTFRRIGGVTDIRPDVRVIAATNRNVPQHVADGRFREDLFYRLNVLWLKLPPLRERPGDIILIARHLAQKSGMDARKPMREIDRDVLAMLSACPWPGNIRELKNAIDRAVLLAESDRLTIADFPDLGARFAAPQNGSAYRFALPAEGLIWDDLELDFVAQALERAGGNQTRAGALLGLTRDQIRYRIEKFKLA